MRVAVSQDGDLYPPVLRTYADEKLGWRVLQRGLDTVEIGLRVADETAAAALEQQPQRALSSGHGSRLGWYDSESGGSWVPLVPGVDVHWYAKHRLLKVRPLKRGDGRLREPVGLGEWLRDGLRPAFQRVGLVLPDGGDLHRLDVAVDVRLDRPDVGRAIFGAFAAARFERSGRFERWTRVYNAGRADPTGLHVVSGARDVQARLYDKGRESGEVAEPWRVVRFEASERYRRGIRPRAALLTWEFARSLWRSRFVEGFREVSPVSLSHLDAKLEELVFAGRITTAEMEQVSGYLRAESRGSASRLYTRPARRRREGLANALGLSVGDPLPDVLPLPLSEVVEALEDVWRDE